MRVDVIKFESCRKQKLSYKLANNGSKGFWHGWKSLKGKKNLDVNHYTSGCQNKDAICEGFKEYFVTSFIDSWNSKVIYDHLKRCEGELLKCFEEYSYTIFSHADVFSAISKL